MKVMYVEGDMAKVWLGLSTEHCGLLMSSHISLVFHSIASVSFQDTLLENMQTNAWPAIKVVRLCQAMPDVKIRNQGAFVPPVSVKTYILLMSAVFPICLFLLHVHLQSKLQYFEN